MDGLSVVSRYCFGLKAYVLLLASPILYMILFSVTTTLLISETEAVPRYFMGRYGKQLRRDFIADRMLNLNTDKAADDDESVCAGNPPRSIMIGWFNQTLDHFGNDTAAAANFSNNGFWGQVRSS